MKPLTRLTEAQRAEYLARIRADRIARDGWPVAIAPVVAAPQAPSCHRCGKPGAACPVYNTVEVRPDGTMVHVIHYCGID